MDNSFSMIGGCYIFTCGIPQSALFTVILPQPVYYRRDLALGDNRAPIALQPPVLSSLRILLQYLGLTSF